MSSAAAPASPTAAPITQAPSSAAPTTAAPSPPPTTPPASSFSTIVPPTTSAPPPSSSAPPPSSSAPPASSSEAQSSASQPPSSSQQPTSQQDSSSAPPPSSDAPSSSAGQSASAAPPSSRPASAAPSSAAASPSLASDITLSSQVFVSSTNAAGQVVSVAPSAISVTRLTTDTNGQVLTVTQIVRNPGVTDNGSGGSTQQSFMNNTGAVAGVFVAVGLLCTAGVLAFVLFMLRRRRRQRLDRDVAAAAAAAAANSSHRSAFDDDDISPAMTQYGGYFAATPAGTDLHGQPQPAGQYHDYIDPAGGYDHYATDLQAGGGDRMSTATGAGLAGFGATGATNEYDQNAYAAHPDQYHTLPSPTDPTSQQHQQDLHLQQQQQQHQQPGPYYFDPNQAYSYTADEEDPYAGYDEPQQPTRPRSGSLGSVVGPVEDRKGLKVTNV